MLQNIHEINTWLKVYSTGGTARTNQIGFLPGYGWVWYHPQGIANILSLACVIKLFHVSFGSAADNEFHVYLTDELGTVLINKVAYNKLNYSEHDYKKLLMPENCRTLLVDLVTLIIVEFSRTKNLKNSH